MDVITLMEGCVIVIWHSASVVLIPSVPEKGPVEGVQHTYKDGSKLSNKHRKLSINIIVML